MIKVLKDLVESLELDMLKLFKECKELQFENATYKEDLKAASDCVSDLMDLNDSLRADRLEMAKAIVENCEYEYICPEYGSVYMVCNYCEEDINKHKEDCIVLKAEEIIGESI